MTDCCNEHLQKCKFFLDHFTILQKRIFALISSKRLLPNYLVFQQKYNLGDYSFLCEYYNYLLYNIASFNHDYKKMVAFYDKIDKICPDSENFGDAVGLLALNAGIAMANTGLFYGNNDDENLYLIIEQGLESAEICALFYNVDDDLRLANIFCAERESEDCELLKKISDTDFNEGNILPFVDANLNPFDYQYVFEHKYALRSAPKTEQLDLA